MPDDPTPTSRTSVELFAGGGGLAMAVHRAGFRPLLLNEYDKNACDTLEANGMADGVQDVTKSVARHLDRLPVGH